MNRFAIGCLALLLAGCHKKNSNDERLIGTWIICSNLEDLGQFSINNAHRLNADGTAQLDLNALDYGFGAVVVEGEATTDCLWETRRGTVNFYSIAVPPTFLQGEIAIDEGEPSRLIRASQYRFLSDGKRVMCSDTLEARHLFINSQWQNDYSIRFD